jgi:hypothetical protein
MPARKAPGDFTGNNAAKLAAERDAVLKERADELTTIVQTELEQNDDVIDAVPLTGDAPVIVDPIEEPSPSQVVIVEEEEEPTEIVRLAEDIPQMTVGRNIYDFEAGKRYRLPKHVVDVLRYKEKLYLRG